MKAGAGTSTSGFRQAGPRGPTCFSPSGWDTPQGQLHPCTRHLTTSYLVEAGLNQWVVEHDEHLGLDAVVVGGPVGRVVAEVGGEGGLP